MIVLTLSILIKRLRKKIGESILYVLFDLNKDSYVYDGVAGNVKSALNNVMIQYRIFVTFLP